MYKGIGRNPRRACMALESPWVRFEVLWATSGSLCLGFKGLGV